MSQARRPRSIELPNVGHKAPIPLGSRVGNTRMEFHAASGLLVATGAGAYIVS